MINRFFWLAITFVCPLFLSAVVTAQSVPNAPVKKDNLLKVLRSKQYQAKEIAEIIVEQGVDFQLTPDVMTELAQAGARPEVLEAVRTHYHPPSKKNLSVNLKNNPAARYQSLIEQAFNQYNSQRDAAGAVATLASATQIFPTNPRAYQLMGYVYLYGLKNFPEAERNMRQAINYGGSAVLRVIHDHNLVFTSTCQGSLYINRNSVRFESDNNEHTFETSDSNIKKIEVNSRFKRLIQMKGGSFKLVLKDNEKETKYSFAPLSGDTDESKMIIRLIGK